MLLPEQVHFRNLSTVLAQAFANLKVYRDSLGVLFNIGY